MAPVSEVSEKETKPFETRAAEVMGNLRDAFLSLMEALPKPIHRAADLEKVLGLSRTLGWQIHRVATSSNPLAAGAHVPGPGAVKQMLQAARRVGVPERCLEHAAQAMEAFEALIEEHAGDRTTFATMIDSLAGREAEGIDLKTRRQAFRVNSQVWGVQVKTFLTCGIIHPGNDSSVYDNILLGGLQEIRRIRAGATLRLTSQRVFDAERLTMMPQALEGGSDEAAEGGPGPNLLPDFCTQPCPELDTYVDHEGTHTYLRETPLGNAGATTLYHADIARGLRWQTKDNTPNHFLWFTAVMKPIEALVLDTLIHRNMFDQLEPEGIVYGSLDRLGVTDPDKYHAEHRLPIDIQVRHLGTGPGRVPTPHVPRYRELVEYVCSRAGWNAKEFEVFRCVVEYPLLNTMVQVRFKLPEKGNW